MYTYLVNVYILTQKINGVEYEQNIWYILELGMVIVSYSYNEYNLFLYLL